VIRHRAPAWLDRKPGPRGHATEQTSDGTEDEAHPSADVTPASGRGENDTEDRA
jgi:hypothetical protein